MTNNSDFQVSRRQLAGVAVAGAVGVALAGCRKNSTSDGGGSSTKSTGEFTNTSTIVDYFKDAGLDNHGDDPHENPPVPSPPFSPQYSIIVDITSRGAWDITMNHVHFSNTAPNLADRNIFALKALANKKVRNHRRFRDERNDQELIPINRNEPPQTPPRLADYSNFSRFGCSAQHDIYVYFDHNSQIEVINTDEYHALFTFSQKRKDGTSVSPNDSFYNASVVDIEAVENSLPPNFPSMLKGKLKGTLLRVENHLTVRSNPLDRTSSNIIIDNTNPGRKVYYKLNIPYIVNAGGGYEGNVIIIDPDTGNGQGYEP